MQIDPEYACPVNGEGCVGCDECAVAASDTRDHINGDAVEPTGEINMGLHGYRWTEGSRKGRTGWTSRPFEPIARAAYDAARYGSAKTGSSTTPQAKW